MNSHPLKQLEHDLRSARCTLNEETSSMREASVKACGNAIEQNLAIDAEVRLLLLRILELTEVKAPPLAYNFDGCEGEEVVAQLEHAGARYRLIKSESTTCPRTTLSRREQEIVRLVSSGHPNKSIAHKLAISQHTVNTHVRRIFGKLGVSTRAEMVAYALQSGLVGQKKSYN